jgi:CubicO group peptidase (beta-lactamase class C family)
MLDTAVVTRLWGRRADCLTGGPAPLLASLPLPTMRPVLRFFLAVVTLIALAAPAAAQPLADELDALLTSFHDAGQLNGSVLLAQGDEVLYERGFGEANMAWDIPNAPDTRFRIGSVTKQFTAALILQFAEDGRLSLDDPITAHLPDYPAAQGDRVTIHHLLTHTAGIPSYTSRPDYLEFSVNFFEPDSLIAMFADLPLEFEPGSEWSYSNSGYYVLGRIVEAVTGEPFDVVLRERLLEPAGLANTGYDHYRAVIERRATGYDRAGSGYERAPYLDSSVPYAAGMMYSTVRDLHQWNRALHAGALFERPATLMQMLTPHMNGYGYGIGVGEITVGEVTVSAIRHGGGINGFSAQLWYLPEDEYSIVVLDNTTQNTSRIADALARAVYDQPQDLPKSPISVEMGAVIESAGIDAAVARYRELKEEEPEAYDFGEGELNSLGYFYLRRGEVDTALRIFQLNVEAYPEASNPYDSLGEAYMEAGERDLAVENYRRSLELNPGNANARRMLGLLGAEVEEPDVEIMEEQLERYTGRYELQPNFILTVTREGDQLYAQATGQPRFEIFPSSENEFYLEVVDAQITFNRGDGGAVESLTLHQSGQSMPAPKIE